MYELRILAPTRVAVDPNRLDRDGLVSVSFRQMSRDVAEGDAVIAVEEEDDGPDYVAGAVVERLDRRHGLAWLRVRWAEMRPESAVPHPASSKALVDFAWSFNGATVDAPQGAVENQNLPLRQVRGLRHREFA